MTPFRVATYNIHKCKGMDGRTRPERILRVLRELHADVIGLQEVVSVPGADADRDQVRFLAEGLAMEFVMGRTRELFGGAYGNAVLSRFGVDEWRHIDITVSGREKRGVLRTDLSIGGARVHVFNLHLGTGFFERRAQAQRLIEEDLLHAPDLAGPHIVVGDFNEWTRGLVTQTLSQRFRRVDHAVWFSTPRVYPGLLPFLHLDYIYYGHGVRLRDAFFVRSPLAFLASDHLPLVADFAL
jgi:endonuclease/exonuclease/phosphatase family metal-dependent hydrolase